jgi:hypothetical protein
MLARPSLGAVTVPIRMRLQTTQFRTESHLVQQAVTIEIREELHLPTSCRDQR